MIHVPRDGADPPGAGRRGVPLESGGSQREEAGSGMDVRGYIEANSGEFFAALKEWLAIPSISADPAHHADVRRSAEWLAARLQKTGFPLTEIWDTGSPGDPGLPTLFAEWPAADPDALTVLVYGHQEIGRASCRERV